MPPLWQQGSRAVLVRLQCHHVEEERLIIASAAVAPIPTLVSSRDWMREGGGHMVLRRNSVAIGNSGLLVFVSNQEEEASVKKCAELAFYLTAVLLAISLTILCPDGLAQTQMVLVTTGSTMPAPLYVLWGDAYHKLHPETQLRYLAVVTS